MPETAVNDPTFGKLVYDGNHHGGWATSFADSRFAGWGSVIEKLFARYASREPAPKTSAESFAKELFAIAGSGIDPAIAEKALENARAFDAYDGSLDVEPLRKAGRFKLVVKNLRDQSVTAAQQAAWRAFRDGGNALADQIIERLFATYREQRPELLRHFNAIYGDSPDIFLPEIASPREMRLIVQPNEFRVHREEDGEGATVSIIFTTLWADKSIDVRIRDSAVVSLKPEATGLTSPKILKRADIPPFGALSWTKHDGWIGRFHSKELRGYHGTAEDRYRFKTSPNPVDAYYRRMPSWSVITGNFELEVSDDAGDGPSAAQAEAYRKFMADTKQTAKLILAALLDWYQELRPDLVEEMDADPEEIEATFPDIESPEGLLEIIELQKVHVWPKPEDDRSVAIGLTFAWADEHGIGVRWRDGRIENVGDWESAADE